MVKEFHAHGRVGEVQDRLCLGYICEVFVRKTLLQFQLKIQLKDLRLKKMQYDFLRLSEKFGKTVTVGDALAYLSNGEYVWKDMT